MGKIIRNGINYGGTYEDATSVNYDGSASGLEARTVQEAVDVLSDSFNNIGYTTNGLVFNKIQCVDGGYCKIGKLVVLNMRIKFLEEIQAFTTIIENLPKPSGSDEVHVSLFGNTTGGLSPLGKLTCDENVAANQIRIINTVYICK